jgi:hypothetical protein
MKVNWNNVQVLMQWVKTEDKAVTFPAVGSSLFLEPGTGG